MKYARIENGIVAELVDVSDGVNISELYHPDLVFVNVSGVDPVPSDGWTYDDNVFAEPVSVVTPDENLATAQSEYVRASEQITALNEQIEDADYAGTTEEDVKAELTLWTEYRKQLRAYIKAGDGNQTLPSSPTI